MCKVTGPRQSMAQLGNVSLYIMAKCLQALGQYGALIQFSLHQIHLVTTSHHWFSPALSSPLILENFTSLPSERQGKSMREI